MTSSAAVARMVGSDPELKNERHLHDLYRTGSIATRALLEVERFPSVVWEPAAGMGDMVAVLVRTQEIDDGHEE